MNGTIIAANRPDQRGAVFTITLPISREQAEEVAA
jgi:signal transduction histidine kinase